MLKEIETPNHTLLSKYTRKISVETSLIFSGPFLHQKCAFHSHDTAFDFIICISLTCWCVRYETSPILNASRAAIQNQCADASLFSSPWSRSAGQFLGAETVLPDRAVRSFRSALASLFADYRCVHCVRGRVAVPEESAREPRYLLVVATLSWLVYAPWPRENTFFPRTMKKNVHIFPSKF